MLSRLLLTLSLLAPVDVTNAAASRFPFDKVNGGTLEQLDTVMSLVSIAENSKTSWWENYDYCEDIKDGRGFTVSLVGFCSGTSDLLGVFKDLQSMSSSHPLVKFIPALEKVDGSESHAGLEDLCASIKQNNDNTWKQAVWNGVLREYWNPSVEWAQKHGLTHVISKGFLFDLALNSGAEWLERMANKVKDGSKPPSEGGDEAKFMQAFMEARAVTNASHKDRVAMWKSILAQGNLDLVRPLKSLKCYGDTFEIVDDGESSQIGTVTHDSHNQTNNNSSSSNSNHSTKSPKHSPHKDNKSHQNKHHTKKPKHTEDPNEDDDTHGDHDDEDDRGEDADDSKDSE